jgi:2-dehydropantoate 2-reductase
MSPGYTKIMTATGSITDDLRRIQSLMHSAGLNCSLSEDVFQEIWEKVAFNNALSTVTAVTKLTVGGIGHFPEGRELSFNIAEEVLHVAEAEGIKVSKERVFGAIESVFTRNSSHLSSMLQDVLACRRTEIDSITGSVIQKAEKHGIRVETVKALYQLVRVIEQSYIV